MKGGISVEIGWGSGVIEVTKMVKGGVKLRCAQQAAVPLFFGNWVVL